METYTDKVARGVDKVARYGWIVRDEKGAMLWINKSDLRIDPTYQRQISEDKRLRIAQNFSWVAFGALSVAMRPDKSLWVVDGSHRLAAAKSRSDISEVPCVLFETVGDGIDEANQFLALNTDRKPLEMLDRFNAMVHADDPIALKAKKLISATGYATSRGGGVEKGPTIRCLRELMRALSNNENATVRVWPLIVSLANGGPIHVRILGALTWLESKLEEQNISIMDRPIRSKLEKAGQEQIIRATLSACEFYHRSGSKIWANGVLELINKGKKNRLSLDSNPADI